MNPPDQEYPIHPTFDRLIQAFKVFSRVTFPRGIPDQVVWRDAVRGMTRYESAVIQRVREYMSGGAVTVPELTTPVPLTQAVAAIQVRSAADADYMNKFQDYKGQVEAIAQTLRDCIEELGNPFRSVLIHPQ
jgi:hypothetical protein